MTESDDNGFKLWWTWFTSTMAEPKYRLNFWAYFFVGVLFCGGAGVWMLCFIGKKPIALMELCSFYLAISGASCVDFIFRDDEKKFLKGFSLVIAAILLIFTLISVSTSSCILSYFVSIVATLISLCLWWLANAHNPHCKDVIKKDAAVGGKTDEEVKGSTEGILT